MKKPEFSRRAMRLSECADLLGVSPEYLKRTAIDTGLLAVYIPPGVDPRASKPGPKTLRVWSDDWEAFTRAQTKTVTQGPTDRAEDARPRPTGSVGPDGKKRIKLAGGRGS